MPKEGEWKSRVFRAIVTLHSKTSKIYSLSYIHEYKYKIYKKKGGLVNLTFHQIEKINFTANALRSIDKDAFLNITFLKSLIVSSEPHLNITSLKLSFHSLPKLKIYELDFNFNL